MEAGASRARFHPAVSAWVQKGLRQAEALPKCWGVPGLRRGGVFCANFTWR